MYKINKQRQVKLRKPEALPLEDDIKKLRNYTIERMQELSKCSELDYWDSNSFTTFRDLVV